MKPEDALRHAREQARRKRDSGEYPADESAVGSWQGGAPGLDELREWAIVEVDPDAVYSTRRGGAPITWLKRLLLRLLRQYTTELEAQQTRFNTAVVAYLDSLEKRD